MSTGEVVSKMMCKIGKKEDKSDCAKKDCEHCRHWILREIWKDFATGREYPMDMFK